MSRPSFAGFVAHKEQIAVTGHVGLPLANLFTNRFKVVDFDISARRVDELKSGMDRTEELSREQLAASKLSYSCDPAVLGRSRFIIVTLPTPSAVHNNPDLPPLVKASEMTGRHIKAGTTVVYESTVYPGCTEEDCLPLIACGSGLTWKNDFFAGYSPERINPGDKEHTVDEIRQVVSGDAPEAAARASASGAGHGWPQIRFGPDEADRRLAPPDGPTAPVAETIWGPKRSA